MHGYNHEDNHEENHDNILLFVLTYLR